MCKGKISEKFMYCFGTVLYFFVGLSATVMDTIITEIETLFKFLQNKSRHLRSHAP